MPLTVVQQGWEARSNMPVETLAPRTEETGQDPVQSPIQTFLKEINACPLLTEEQERAFAEMKDRDYAFFEEQAAILERAILEDLAAHHPPREPLEHALLTLKELVLRREAALAGDHAAESAEPLTPEACNQCANAALRRMARAARHKKTFKPRLTDVDQCTDAAFAHNVFAIMRKLPALCRRITTSDTEEVAALASIAREAFRELRSTLPDGHPCRETLVERDAAFARDIMSEPLCREYLEPLLQGRVIDRVTATTPREVLVRANLRFVVHIARSYMGRRLPLADLIQEGSLGLERAIDGFDPARHTRVSTYASYWIRQTIKRAIINQARTVRIPNYIVELITKWRDMRARLENEVGRPPTDEEVQARLLLPEEKLTTVKQALALQRAQFLTDGEADEKGEVLPVADMVEGREITPYEQVELDDDRALLAALMAQLDEREATVIRLRFPEDGSEGKTLKEIGGLLGLTRERVRQIEAKTLKLLKETMQDKAGPDNGAQDMPHPRRIPLGTMPTRIVDLRCQRSPQKPLPERTKPSNNAASPQPPLTTDSRGVASPSSSPVPHTPMPRRAIDAEPKRYRMTPEEKSAVQKNIQALIAQHTRAEVLRRIQEKGAYSDRAVSQAIDKARKGGGLSSKYVSDIAGIFGQVVASGMGHDVAVAPRRKPARPDHAQPRASVQTEAHDEVLADEFSPSKAYMEKLAEAFRQKLAGALKISLVKTAEGKVVFRARIDQTQIDIEPV